MATFILSFRIDLDATYQARYASTVSAIRAEAKNGRWWDETTSYFLIEADKTADSLARSVYLRADLDLSKDALLVVNVTNNSHATLGRFDEPGKLASFFPTNALARIVAGL